jgi:uncharacterized protein
VAGKPRAVVDTNVFVSGLINPKGPPAGVLQALRSKRFTLVTSPPINEEIIEVLSRPYIRNRYGLGDRIFDIAFILWELAEVVADLPALKVSKDAEDDKFLATAVGGHAEYLVTGDVAHLLPLERYKDVMIVAPREFLSVLKA